MRLVVKIFVALSFVIGFHLSAQTIPHCKFTYNAKNKSVEEVLRNIESQCTVSFSYNVNRIPVDSLINHNFEQVEIANALYLVLGKELKTMVVGNTIVLKRPSSSGKTKSEKLQIKGVITDKRTKKKLKDVTVYSSEELKPVLTDSTGMFVIEVDDPEPQTLYIRKDDYLDTLIVVSPVEMDSDPKLIDLIYDLNLKAEIDSLMEEIDSLSIMKWLRNTDFQKHARNLGNSMVMEAPYQVSVIPGVSSNGLMNSASENTLSLNILGGYTGKINGIEIGGVLNIVKQSVNGLQASGFSNIVGGKLNGVQIGGFSNITLNEMNGVQAAGFFNMVKGKGFGVQVAGFANLSTKEQNGIQVAGFANVCPKEVNSTQISGFANYGKALDGLQIAGFSNISPYETRGTQISGYFNIGSHLKGTQFAGFANIATYDTRGVQIAGFLNHTGGTMRGVQIAGFFNYAKRLKGVQIGLINTVVDSIQGVPIGLLTIAPKGYFRTQLEYSPTIPAKISFKTGIRGFYNILSAGFVKPEKFSLGYGVGTMIPIGKYVGIQFDITADQFTENNQIFETDLLLRSSSGLTLRLGKRLELFGNYNLNTHFYKTGESISKELYYDFDDLGNQIEAFQDWSIGIRI